MSRVITFISRNKDNIYVPKFKPRTVNFLSDKSGEELMKDFQSFVDKGLPHEFCRFYIGVNEVDEVKVKKELAKFLIDEAVCPTNWKLESINNKMVSLAGKIENKVTKKWLFDCDTDAETVIKFADEISNRVDIVGIYPTPHGYAVVTKRGFDTRGILEKYPDIELKKDAPLCYAWKANE